MKELEFLEIIKNTLTNSSLIGDDCAFLEDLDIFVTQDTLVEDVHFSLYTTSAYYLGRKAVSVNLSDLAAALATPKYITVSVSMPKLTDNKFISELYRGINDVCNEWGVKVIGGDITASDKVVISICAIGKKSSLFLSSRANAKKDDLILVTGNFGSAAAGLHALSEFLYADEEIIMSQINPKPRIKEASILANLTDSNIVVTDASDGLIDSLYKIAVSSKHSLKIDINKVPVSQKVKEYCKRNNLDCYEFAKWGGEDYELVICASEALYSKLDENIFKCIGTVQNKDNTPSVIIEKGNITEKITKEAFESNSYNHFKI